MTHFRETGPNLLKENPFTLIGCDWMLVTSGTENGFNTMTASWGGLGVLWNKNVTFIFVRPGRYTYEFLEKHDTFSLSFFTPKYSDTLNYCGKVSGRDVDKVKEAGLTPVFDRDTVYFREARQVITCKKIYYQDIDPANFKENFIDKCYPLKDYHRMYVGEITAVLEQ